MKIIKQTLPFITVALAVICLLLITMWSYTANSIENSNDALKAARPADTDLEPINIALSFNNSNAKYENEAKIETYDFLQSFRYEYVNENTHFVSSIEGWEEEKLKEAAEEFYKNVHGEEMRYVNAVIFEEGNGRYCYGSNQKVTMNYTAPTTLYNFFPENNLYHIPLEVSFLKVSNIAPHLDIADIAQAMSVAYGYHFTQFNMDITGTEDDAETQYYKLRADGNDKIKLEIASNDEYADNFAWYLEQLAAYDYMFLMGSPNANRILTKFPHMPYHPYESMDEIYKTFNATFVNSRNTTPHVNLNLTMPDRVDGLREYFYSFVEEDMPEYNLAEDMKDLNFETRITRLDSKYRKVISMNAFKLTWDVPYEDENIKYSLIKTNMNDEIVSIKAMNMKSSYNSTIIDHPTIRSLNRTMYYFDMRTIQEFKMYLVAVFPDGSITVSEPVELKYSDENWD